MADKSVSDQIKEIAKPLADSQRRQDQAQYALRRLRERVEAEARGTPGGPA